MNRIKKSRNLQIDTLRGIACILLVAYHVIGSSASVGLKISDGLYRELNDILAYIRMPLFTFLSGVVYAYRPFTDNSGKFIKGKIRRLLMPMLIVGTLFAVMQAWAPGSNSSTQNWLLLHVIPVGHFWFIEAIFIIFMLIIPFEIIGGISNIRNATILFFLSILLYLSNLDIPYFAISGAIYLLPFFLSGVVVQRFELISKVSVKSGVFLLALITLILVLIYIELLASDSKRTLVSLLIGILGCIGLLSLKFESYFIARIGAYSYTIYLFHVFFTAGSRIVLTKLGYFELNVIIVASLLAGIIGPIILENIFDKYSSTRILLLGKSKLKTV
ncbi:MAG: acyltransferase [Moritella sp.]|uniref:acyltransferase family protein n=1 Tax=Moritella sp. TaxID=78556 RepID=UPI0025EBD0BC|nr:acyltransferase [Moritella sp.]NQZ93767.1 acyltransferase [Moritella sp.]